MALAIALAGCSSGVKLSDVPVETRTPGAVAAPGTGPGGSTGPATQSRVEPVAADPAAGLAPGPQGVGRVVYFDYDSNAIKPEFQNIIEAHARYMKANTARRVAIEGHTDERGGREYNLALGQRRSEAVRRALGLLGVADNQIEAVSFGKEKPAVQGSDESSWSQNRRAEIAYR
ncbi:MAG TPA: peptidoglycan-associated lipoprotein Pal [Ramlibacter sp.]|nr:peptidoglycan-associated lipoprotein Pal [Ramlibacter sp.]